MILSAEAGGLATLLAASASFAYLPRRLYAEVGEAPSRRQLCALFGAIAFSAGAVFAIGRGLAPVDRLATAAAVAACTAVVYADLRFLVIPDLLSAVLASLAFVTPPAGGVGAAAAGALTTAGLLATVRWMGRRGRRDALGLGDVKLAVGLGGLLGPRAALWTVACAAAVGVAWGFALDCRKAPRSASDERTLIPFGALLAAAAAVALLRARL